MRNGLFLAVLVLLASCSSNPPTIDFDPSEDFSQWSTFAFISDNPLMRAEGAQGGNPLLEGRLMQTTENILAGRGFTRVPNREDADLVVAFTIGARDKIQVNSYPEPYRPYYGGWGWGGAYYAGSSNVDVRQYTEGTIAIDFYEVEERKPVWHGSTTKRITSDMQKNQQEAVEQILSELLASFPPLPASD